MAEWDSPVVGHRPDSLVQKHKVHTDLMASTRIDLSERRRFLDPLAMEMGMDPSHKPLGLVQDWGYSRLEARFYTETCIVELGPSSLEEMAEEYRNHSLEQKPEVGI